MPAATRHVAMTEQNMIDTKDGLDNLEVRNIMTTPNGVYVTDFSD